MNKYEKKETKKLSKMPSNEEIKTAKTPYFS